MSAKNVALSSTVDLFYLLRAATAGPAGVDVDNGDFIGQFVPAFQNGFR